MLLHTFCDAFLLLLLLTDTHGSCGYCSTSQTCIGGKKNLTKADFRGLSGQVKMQSEHFPREAGAGGMPYPEACCSPAGWELLPGAGPAGTPAANAGAACAAAATGCTCAAGCGACTQVQVRHVLLRRQCQIRAVTGPGAHSHPSASMGSCRHAQQATRIGHLWYLQNPPHDPTSSRHPI